MQILTPARTLFLTMITDLKNLSWKSERCILSIRACIASLLALLIAWAFHIDNPTWAAWTGFAVVQVSRGATISNTLERILTTTTSVFVAWAIMDYFQVSTPVLLFIAVVGMTICLYFSAKSRTPFVWLYGPITFLMVVFSSPALTASVEIAHTAYLRGLEVAIGSLCALVVTFVLRSPFAKDDLKKNNSALLKSLAKLQVACLNRYRFNQPDPAFQRKLKDLIALADTQIALRRFVRQERLFTRRATFHSAALEHVVFMAQEIIAGLYLHHQNHACSIMQRFSVPLQALQEAIAAAFEAMVEYIDGEGKNANQLSIMFDRWQVALQHLMQQAAQFREQQGVTVAMDEMHEWSNFLVRQEELLWLLRHFNDTTPIKASKVSRKARWRHFFVFDRYYWEYAFKSGLLVVLLPFIGLSLHLNGVLVLSLMTALSLQFDFNVTKQKLFSIVAGAVIGTFAALVFMAFNFTHIWAYLLGITLFSFFLAYIKYGPSHYIFTGLLSSYLFFTDVLVGPGPLESWQSAVIILAMVLVGALFLLVFLIWIWPFSDRRMLQHYHAQLQWYTEVIHSALLPLLQQNQAVRLPTLPLRPEFNGLRNQLRDFRVFSWANPQFGKTTEVMATLWYRYYHLLAGVVLALQTLDLSQQDPQIMRMVEKALALHQTQPNLQAVASAVADYKQLLRARFLVGDRLPFADSIKIIHLLNLLEDLALCHQALLEQRAHD